MKKLTYQQLKQVTSQDRYAPVRFEATEEGKNKLTSLNLIDEIYNLAVNEGSIKKPLKTDAQKRKWIAQRSNGGEIL